jgi:hypothetical protein
VLVVVIAVLGVTVAAVHVVDMVAVRHGLMATVGPMVVLVRTGDHMHVIECALVVMILVAAVCVALVEVIHVAVVLDRDVAAVGAVHVGVSLVGGAGGGHGYSSAARCERAYVATQPNIGLSRCHDTSSMLASSSPGSGWPVVDLGGLDGDPQRAALGDGELRE